jgi:hypothetical protein
VQHLPLTTCANCPSSRRDPHAPAGVARKSHRSAITCHGATVSATL